jgi:hypothetical protein
MNSNIRLTILVAAALGARLAYGHGQPIVVNSDGERLTVSSGTPHSDGYATFSFDHSEGAQLYDLFGGAVVWSTPGFDRTGGAVGLPLELQILPRPDFSESPTVSRWLWYWNPVGERVKLIDDERFLAINSETNPDPNTFTVTQFAGPAGGYALSVPFLHHPVSFALDDSLPTPAANGAYGFFARLRSPGLQPSAPFLIAQNYNLSSVAFDAGAAAINRAAGLPGDYDLDADVDGNDFLVWQRTLGTGPAAADATLDGVVDAGDLAVWQQDFGRRTDFDAFATTIPEPTGAAIVVAATLAAWATRRARSSVR